MLALSDLVNTRASGARSETPAARCFVVGLCSAHEWPGRTPPTEAAVERTLRGWCAELDTGRKFLWGDWNSIIRDVFVAMRTGEAMAYDED